VLLYRKGGVSYISTVLYALSKTPLKNTARRVFTKDDVWFNLIVCRVGGARKFNLIEK
jgi:limonene-1,2-epoxide hydrolase